MFTFDEAFIHAWFKLLVKSGISVKRYFYSFCDYRIILGVCDWDVGGYKENLWDKTFLQYQFCQILQVPYFENESELLGSKKGSHDVTSFFIVLMFGWKEWGKK